MLNKKGENGMGNIVKIILVLLAVLATIAIVYQIKILLSNSDKFTKPETKQDNNFLFTAEDIIMSENTYCQLTNVELRVYKCTQGGVDFFVNISNQDSTIGMRSFYGGIVVCSSELKRGIYYVDKDDKCFNEIVSIGDRCNVQQASTQECNPAYYDLSTLNSGTYNIYPVADCYTGNSDSACKVTNPLEKPRNVNKEKYITIIID